MHKHLVSNVKGENIINKESLADIVELIRTSPTSSRLFFLLAAYSNNDNYIITNIATLSKMLGIVEIRTKNALQMLLEDGYIEIHKVKLQHSNTFMGVQHDKDLWKKSNFTEWKVIGEKPIGSLTLSGCYMKIILNDFVIKSKTERDNNFLLNIDKHLYYDTSIKEDDILWEM